MDHKCTTSCYRRRALTFHARSAMAIIRVQRGPKMVICEEAYAHQLGAQECSADG
jgi:hypothetical protein